MNGLRWRLRGGRECDDGLALPAEISLARLNPGIGEERDDVRLLFATDWYLKRYPDVAVAGIDPLAHYLERGVIEGRDPHPLFDTRWYLDRHPDVAAAGVNPLIHYLERGAAAGYEPHPMFCSPWYRERYPDAAAAGMNPLAHYIQHGGLEGRDPHPLFDRSWYLRRYPDIVAAGVNPLIHYIECGAAEGRLPGPLISGPDDWEKDHRIAATARARYDWEIGRHARSTAWAQGWVGKLARLPALALIRLGRLCYRHSLIFLASAAYNGALFLSPAHHDELLELLAKCDARRKRFDQAFACFIRRCDLLPPLDTSIQTATMPLISRATKTRTIGVITSVMPRRIAAQQAALQSWRTAGLSVVSVNAMSEAAELREHFPDITFRILEKPVVDTRGRPFVPIQALMQAAKETSADVCGIINSDVEFRGETGFFDSVRQEVPGSLVFGSRIDFRDATMTDGMAFRNGYDFFFWGRENSALFEETPMVLGLPWWDFWLPLHAYAQGLRVKRFITSSMIHFTHPVGYDLPTYVKFGQLCAKTLSRAYGRWSDEHVPADRAFLHRLFTTGATIPVSRDPDEALRRIGALCDLSNCLIDVISEPVAMQDARLAAGTLDPL